jgi:hypothetical protein
MAIKLLPTKVNQQDGSLLTKMFKQHQAPYLNCKIFIPPIATSPHCLTYLVLSPTSLVTTSWWKWWALNPNTLMLQSSL